MFRLRTRTIHLLSRRHRKGRPVHGILLLDKPSGGSSNHALQRAKRLYGARKAGHTGSLDPLATGMLPICFGEATKLCTFLLDADKGYEVTLRLGITTDSADADGDVLECRPVPKDLTADAFTAVCQQFTGHLQQVPPMVSAIKIDGQRLYRLARQGKSVDRPPRPVTIHELNVIDFSDTVARLAVRCSKGTYIRSLVTDIGEVLGCGAHVTALRRTFVSPFQGRSMVCLQAIERIIAESGGTATELNDIAETRLHQLLLPLDAGLPHLPIAKLDGRAVVAFRQGQAAVVRAIETGLEGGTVDGPVGASGNGSEDALHDTGIARSASSRCDVLCRVHDATGRLIGLGEYDPTHDRVAPKRVIQWD